MSRLRAKPGKDRHDFPHLRDLPDDLYDYLSTEPWPRAGRPPKHDLSTWTVTDDWPEQVPVTEVEVDVFESWFGDFFDEVFGPGR